MNDAPITAVGRLTPMGTASSDPAVAKSCGYEHEIYS